MGKIFKMSQSRNEPAKEDLKKKKKKCKAVDFVSQKLIKLESLHCIF